MIISAARANEIMFDARLKEFKKFSKEINELIGQSITARQKFADLKIEGLFSTWPVRMTPMPSLSQEIVIEELFSEFNFGAAIVPEDEEFVPAGLQDENGDGPKYRNYFIQIGW